MVMQVNVGPFPTPERFNPYVRWSNGIGVDYMFYVEVSNKLSSLFHGRDRRAGLLLGPRHQPPKASAENPGV
jgi:hypothetical protein